MGRSRVDNRKTTDDERAMWAARPLPPFEVYEHARAIESTAWRNLRADPTEANRRAHDLARAYLLDVVAGRVR